MVRRFCEYLSNYLTDSCFAFGLMQNYGSEEIHPENLSLIHSTVYKACQALGGVVITRFFDFDDLLTYLRTDVKNFCQMHN